MLNPKDPPSQQEQNETLSLEAANELVLEHHGWAESIARSVARSWNLDWKLDGLDGAAMEAIIFCARRFQPSRGVPFRGYARKRIHEAATEAARRSRGWRKSTGDQQARNVSIELFNVFPELRLGQLPGGEEGGSDDVRSAVRQLLVGASIIAARQSLVTELPDQITDYKKMVQMIAQLDPVHQTLLWEVYWEGNSMRSVASSWEVDELSVIREHKTLLAHLLKSFQKPKVLIKLKVRPALKSLNVTLKKDGNNGPFSKLMDSRAELRA